MLMIIFISIIQINLYIHLIYMCVYVIMDMSIIDIPILTYNDKDLFHWRKARLGATDTSTSEEVMEVTQPGWPI